VQTLKVFQSLWAMETGLVPALADPLDVTIARIAKAGFDGVCLDPCLADIEHYRSVIPLLDRHGLASMVNLFPATVDEMSPLLAFAREAGAVKVSAVAQVMPLTPAGAVPLIYRWLQEARQMGVELLFETHRDSLLNDLFFTLQVLDEVPELKLTADLSHIVINREFGLPLSARDQDFIARIHERSDCFQGRVATREQIQVPLAFPQHQPWVTLFKGFWKDGMRSWRRRNGPDAECVFVSELGPPSYAITDANGNELSDRWEEALTIQRWAREAWAELVAEAAR
jgi:hypothetical protein